MNKWIPLQERIARENERLSQEQKNANSPFAWSVPDTSSVQTPMQTQVWTSVTQNQPFNFNQTTTSLPVQNASQNAVTVPKEKESNSIFGKILGGLEWVDDQWGKLVTAPFRGNQTYEVWKKANSVASMALGFTNPIWLLPGAGWIGKALQAVKGGERVGKLISLANKAGKLTLPTTEELSKQLYKPNTFRKFATAVENVPVLGNVIKAVGGPAAFVKTGENLSNMDKAKRAVVNYSYLLAQREGVKGHYMARLNVYGDPVKLMRIDNRGLSGIVKERAGFTDVIENPDAYTWLPGTQKAREYVNEARRVQSELRELAAKEGVELPRDILMHRTVLGKTTPKGFEKTEYGSSFELSRHHKTMAEGIDNGIQYDINPSRSVELASNYYMKKIAQKRLDNEIGSMGKTVTQRLDEFEPEFTKQFSESKAKLDALDNTDSGLTRYLSSGSTKLHHQSVLSMVDNLSPAIAAKLTEAMSIKAVDIVKTVQELDVQFYRKLGLSKAKFKRLIGQGKLSIEDISETLRNADIPEPMITEVADKLFNVGLNTAVKKTAIKSIRDEVRDLAVIARKEYKPLEAKKIELAEKYRYPRLGENEAIFREVPQFGGKIFPAEVVKAVEPALSDYGKTWLKNLGSVSQVSRTTTATMDISAPFIQGLMVFGRNPVVWAKGCVKQLEFAINPQRFQEYLNLPETMAIRAERLRLGGSPTSFEYYEGAPVLKEAAGKLGQKVGGQSGRALAEGAIANTIGRAETAFLGYGEYARNELFKAYRNIAKSEDELRELVRSIDRMTGVMSTEALGIGKTQREFESTFMFFAPRYTRAGLALMGDIVRGGIAGNQARAALGSTCAAGAAVYIASCKALGQEPNFDPSSGQFMTVEVGNRNVGIGGVFYSLMRMGANVEGAIAEGEWGRLSPLYFNRVDNPFYNWIYSRSAPLTGLAFGALVEKEDFMGRPLEDPADYARFLADKFTPIALQDATPWSEEQEDMSILPLEFTGLRTFPFTSSEKLGKARDKLAMEMYGTAYDTLSELDQYKVDANPSVELAQGEVDEQTVIRGEAQSVAYLNRKREMETARTIYLEELWQAQKAFDNGLLTAQEFKEMAQDTGTELRGMYKLINENPAYTDVLAELSSPKDISGKYKGDVAFDEYTDTMYGDSFTDEYGLYNYKKAEAYKEEFKAKWGNEIYTYVLDRLAKRNSELPPMMQEYIKAREILRPYWQVQDKYIEIFGEPVNKYQASKLAKIIAKYRKQLLLKNKDMAYYHDLFYGGD